MQPTPFRLSQALWTAFRAAKPSHKHSPFQQTRLVPSRFATPPWSERTLPGKIRPFARPYSDNVKSSEVDRQAEDAKKRIDQSLDSRADIAQDAEPALKPSKDETIVHTLPEASSIVHSSEASSGASQEARSSQNDSEKSDSRSSSANSNKYAEWASTRWQNSPLPSQIASLRSRANKRFTAFMDNLQSNIVVAAHHLNDLTGYSGIERLKKEIEAQESAVQEARKHVKDSREKYSQAIAMRSDTQREVNDLLHRKHAWSPTDLERFTHLYRSDHANEQAEQKTHQTLSQAEAQYEEASTRLAKSILARYHEEQIWSDKIRQMSTWGTWGLMGLNVLLFIVFQILIEPWRRRRLVRGFEEKVQAALDEKERATDEKFAMITPRKDGDQVIQEAVQKEPEGLVATAAEEAAELIADAVTGASSEDRSETPTIVEIENAAEQVAQKELDDETQSSTTTPSAATLESESLPATTSPDSPPTPQTETSSSSNDPTVVPIETLDPEPEQSPNLPETWQNQLEATLNSSVANARQAYADAHETVIQLFNEKEHVVLSKRDLTTKVLEGVAAGVAITCGIMFIVARGR